VRSETAHGQCRRDGARRSTGDPDDKKDHDGDDSPDMAAPRAMTSGPLRHPMRTCLSWSGDATFIVSDIADANLNAAWSTGTTATSPR